MKKISILIATLLLSSCASEIKKEKSQATDTVATLEKECAQKNGLSCAKLGYLLKSTDSLKSLSYYKKGCELGDQSSCFNLESAESSGMQALNNFLSSQTTNIIACYYKFNSGDGGKTAIGKVSGYRKNSFTVEYRALKNGTHTNLHILGAEEEGQTKECVDKILNQRSIKLSQDINISKVYDIEKEY